MRNVSVQCKVDMSEEGFPKSEKFGEHHLCMLPQLGVSNKPERWRKEREAYLAVARHVTTPREGTNNNISDMRSKDVTNIILF